MRVYLPALVLVLAFMAPAMAEGTNEQPASTATSAGTADEDLNQVVCKKTGPPIGSHLGSRTVCLSKKKWQEQERTTQDALQRSQNNRGLSGQPGG